MAQRGDLATAEGRGRQNNKQKKFPCKRGRVAQEKGQNQQETGIQTGKGRGQHGGAEMAERGGGAPRRGEVGPEGRGCRRSEVPARKGGGSS